MEMNEYQRNAEETAVYPKEHALPYVALGVAGEAGEFANKVKKILRGDKPLDDGTRYELECELGDILWYVAAAATELGFTLSHVAELNTARLLMRKANNTIKGSGDER